MTPFQFTAEDLARRLGRVEEIEDEITDIRNEKYKELGAWLRLHVVKPFCQKFNLTFDTGMGQWSFCYVRQGKRKCWYVGEDRRELPGRPDTEDGDEWYAEITYEEKLIKKLLDRGDDRGYMIGLWISDYPDKHGT